jgi:hypothetical protein
VPFTLMAAPGGLDSTVAWNISTAGVVGVVGVVGTIGGAAVVVGGGVTTTGVVGIGTMG